jgi:hypothetical protein
MPGNIDPSPGGCLSPADKQQSQSVNPLCGAPDLDPSSGGLPMRLASSKQEREAIFRLRYDVLVDELDGGAGHPEADAASRTLRDEWDESAHHFYLVRDGAVVASARVNLSRDGNVELRGFDRDSSLHALLSQLDELRVSAGRPPSLSRHPPDGEGRARRLPISLRARHRVYVR